MPAPALRPAATAPPLGAADYARLYALRKAASTQTRHTIAWLCRHARELTGDRSRPRILSVGCGEGDVEIAMHDALREEGVPGHFTAVEPSAPQRARLRARLRSADLEADFDIRGVGFEALSVRGDFDLVLICQSAYYFDRPSLPFLFRRAFSLTAPGGGLVIAHQSRRGVPQLQARHMMALRGDLETALHGDDIAALLGRDPMLPFDRRRHHVEIPAALDLRACLDPTSQEGLDILSFCLECDLGGISAARLAALRADLSALAVYDADGARLPEPVDVFWLRRGGRSVGAEGRGEG